MTSLHHSTTHSMTYKMAIVLRPQICDVASPYVFARPRLTKKQPTGRSNHTTQKLWVWSETAEPIDMPFGTVDLGGPK